jgi:hypothetical protein
MRAFSVLAASSGRRRLVALLSLSLALLVPACSKGGPKVYPVRGQVLVEGRPAARATITFHPVGGAAEGLRPSAQTDEQGYFRLTSYAGGDGAPEGEYAVTVTWFRAFAARNLSEGDENTRNLLPPRYANPATSQLKATVTKDTNELPPFQVRAR